MSTDFRLLTSLLALLLLTAGGCRKAEGLSPSGPRVEESSSSQVTVKVSVDPAIVRYDRDTLLTITITSPSEIEAALPQLGDRLQGFTLNEVLDAEPVTRGGTTTVERRARLTPTVSAEHRIAPMAIVHTDKSRSPAETGWFATKPIVLDAAPAIMGPLPGDIDADLKPIWIRPSNGTIVMYVLFALAGALAVFAMWKLLRRVRRQIRLMRMSPRERALRELEELLARGLVEKELVKEFYLELTMVVRRYIERQHSVRAPEQTTEEFLVAVSLDPRFSPDTVRRLKTFLQAADLVKFAADHPDTAATARATETARTYIEQDSPVVQAEKERNVQVR